MIKQCPSNKNSQHRHTQAVRKRRGVRRVSFHNTELDRQSSSALALIFFKVAVLAMGTMSEICHDQYLWVCLIKRRTNIQVLTKGLGHTKAGLQLVYTGIWCENSGSVLGWCPKRSSDPCPRLVLQKLTLLVHSGQTWKRDLGLGRGMMFTFPFYYLLFCLTWA